MENNLLFNTNNNFTIDSKEIAEMLGMKHYKILEKLEGTKDGKTKGIIPVLNDHEIVAVDYFIKSSYIDAKGQERPCYLFTKKGCDFIANKFTNEKGIIFTAKYVDRFHSMEEAIKNNQLSWINEKIRALEILTNNFESLTNEVKQYFKPLHRTKLEYNRLIKSLTSNNQEANLVKRWVFMKMGIRTWEDTCLDDSTRIKELIQSTSKLVQIDDFEQISLLQ